jgi:hypothetical protein
LNDTEYNRQAAEIRTLCRVEQLAIASESDWEKKTPLSHASGVLVTSIWNIS